MKGVDSRIKKLQEVIEWIDDKLIVEVTENILGEKKLKAKISTRDVVEIKNVISHLRGDEIYWTN